MQSEKVEMRLSELGKIVGGATPSTKQKEYYDGDIAWITPKDLSEYNQRWISHGNRSITKEGFDSCSTQMLPKGSILFSSRAPIGYVAIAENPLCTNQGFKSIIPNESVVNPLYLYYLLKFYTPNIESTASGTTFKEVSGAAMKNFKVIIPKSIEEQERIANILDSLDNKIENNNKIIKNLENLAQKIVLTIMRNAKDKNNALENYALINPKRTLKKGTHARYIDMSALSTVCATPEYCNFKDYAGGIKFSNGDSILARITPCLENGKAAFINFLNENEIAFGSTEFITLHSKGELPNEFFYCLIRTKAFREFAIKHLTGTSGRQRISAKDIEKYPLPTFNVKEVDYLNNHLPILFKYVLACATQNKTLAQIRDLLLHKLFSGDLEPLGKK